MTDAVVDAARGRDIVTDTSEDWPGASADLPRSPCRSSAGPVARPADRHGLPWHRAGRWPIADRLRDQRCRCAL